MSQLKYFLTLFIILLILWALSKRIRNNKLTVISDSMRFCFVFLILLEIAMNVLYRIENNTWLFSKTEHPNRSLFQRQPYLGVSNKHDLNLSFNGHQIRTDVDGHRFTDSSNADDEAVLRIAAIGGSTTFGVAVSDAESWPGILQGKTGSDTVVFNLGVPGHTTVEHLVMAGIYLETIRPDMIVIQCGMNDMRMSHVNEIKGDYSNFHYPDLIGTMGLCYLEALPAIASIYYLVRLMQECGVYPVCEFNKLKVSGVEGKGPDMDALGIYEGNLRRLIHACRYYTEDIFFLPQIIKKNISGPDKMKWWFPHLEGGELNEVMEVYNNKTREVALELSVIYADGLFTDISEENDFADDCHLNASGNAKVVRKLYELIKISSSTLEGARQ